MNKLFVHIGTYKTGSTPIQSWLNRNKESFKAYDVHYIPEFHQYRKCFKEDDPKKISEISSFLKECIGTKKNKTFVISSEHLAGAPLEGYANSGIVARNLKKLVDSLDVEVSIIAYLRRQDDFFESLYTQYIHIGESFSFDEFYKKYGQNDFDWHKLLNNYSAVFDKKSLIVRSYDKMYLPEHQSIFQDFGKILMLPDAVIAASKPPEVQNMGYSRDALEVALLCNKDLDKNDQNLLRIILQNSNAKRPFEKYAYFTPEQRSEFMQRYTASNEAVLTEYLVDNKGKLFTEISSQSPNYSGLDLEKFIKLVVNIEIYNFKKAKQNSATLKWVVATEGRLRSFLKKFRRTKMA